MAQEFVAAFRDLQKDATNHDKLASFVRRHYVSRLNGPELASALTSKLVPEQRGNDPLIVNKFFHDLACHYREHSAMLTTLKSMDESFARRIDSIDVSKKVSAVSFMLAAMFFVAAAAIAAANGNPTREAAGPSSGPAVAGPAEAGLSLAGPAVAAAAAAASILFGGVGKWIHSLLNKRETATRGHKEITAFMINGAESGMGDLCSIQGVARRLNSENKSLSETVDDGNRVAALKRGFEELVAKIEAYSDTMKRAKEVVLQCIIKHSS